MGTQPKTRLTRWRRIQLAKFLLEERGLDPGAFGYDDQGALVAISAPPGLVEETVTDGFAFMTNGCPAPAASRAARGRWGAGDPSEAPRDYPWQPTESDRTEIRAQLRLGRDPAVRARSDAASGAVRPAGGRPADPWRASRASVDRSAPIHGSTPRSVESPALQADFWGSVAASSSCRCRSCGRAQTSADRAEPRWRRSCRSPWWEQPSTTLERRSHRSICAVAFFLVLGSVVGAYAGAHASRRVPESALKMLVAMLLAVVGLKELHDVVLGGSVLSGSESGAHDLTQYLFDHGERSGDRNIERSDGRWRWSIHSPDFSPGVWTGSASRSGHFPTGDSADGSGRRHHALSTRQRRCPSGGLDCHGRGSGCADWSRPRSVAASPGSGGIVRPVPRFRGVPNLAATQATNSGGSGPESPS